MERLTEKHYKAYDGYYMKCSEGCHLFSCEERERFGEEVDRLGQIEDILGDTYDLDRLRGILNICNGKTPNQVEGIFAEWSHYLDFAGKMNAIEDAVDAIYDDGNVNYDRLRELVEAERAGKIMILPVKPGEYIYLISLDSEIVPCRVGNIAAEEWGTSFEGYVDGFGTYRTGPNDKVFFSRMDAVNALKREVLSNENK